MNCWGFLSSSPGPDMERGRLRETTRGGPNTQPTHPRHPPTPPPPSPTPPPPAVSVKKLQPWHLPAGEELWALPQTHLETSGAYSLSPLPTISYPSGRSKAQQGNATPGNAHPWSQARVARSRWRPGRALCKDSSRVEAWRLPGGGQGAATLQGNTPRKGWTLLSPQQAPSPQNLHVQL